VGARASTVYCLRGLQFRDLAWEALMPASGWLFQAVASVILAVFVFGVAWLIFASVKRLL